MIKTSYILFQGVISYTAVGVGEAVLALLLGRDTAFGLLGRLCPYFWIESSYNLSKPYQLVKLNTILLVHQNLVLQHYLLCEGNRNCTFQTGICRKSEVRSSDTESSQRCHLKQTRRPARYTIHYKLGKTCRVMANLKDQFTSCSVLAVRPELGSILQS